MTIDWMGQGEVALRLLVASALGGLIGLERELHGHPAGTRTHLLVSLGAAIFTVLSMQGFAGDVVDPTRIAAQIVSGIGFLGAGAIIRSGTSVRGLTTAASLWATASVGLALGAAQYAIGIVGTAIIVLSLGPLRRLVRSRQRASREQTRLRLELTRLEALGEIARRLEASGADIATLSTRDLQNGRYEIDAQLRGDGVGREELVASLAALPDVRLVETGDAQE